MIYIVRHGQTDYNVEKRITGQLDIPLNEKGRDDALKLKEKLKDISFDYVFASPLKRTVETAKIATNNQDIILDRRIIERYNGSLEGMVKDEIEKDFDFNDINSKKYGIESVRELKARVYDFLDEIIKKYPKKNILIVTHGGVLIVMRHYFEGKPKNNDDYFMTNCEIVKYNN